MNNTNLLHQLQTNYLHEVLSSLTRQERTLIKRRLTKLVNERILSAVDRDDIAYVIAESLVQEFYNLETHPREVLWRILTGIRPVRHNL